jgi:hypothetical protein
MPAAKVAAGRAALISEPLCYATFTPYYGSFRRAELCKDSHKNDCDIRTHTAVLSINQYLKIPASIPIITGPACPITSMIDRVSRVHPHERGIISRSTAKL